MFGVIFACVGGSVLIINARRFSDISPVVGPLLDSNAWGILWIGCGLVSVIAGVRRAWSAGDGPGFGALLIPPAVWTIFYAASAVAWFVTGGEFGRVNSITGAIVWSIVWFVVLLVAGWPETDRRRPPDDEAPPPPEGT